MDVELNQSLQIMEAFIQWPTIQNLELEKIEMEMRLTAQPLNHNIETSKELE